MKTESQQQLLRIFINETDEWQGEPLYKAIVDKLRRANLAGCTVVRGMEGFGSSRQMHDARFEGLFFDLPMIIEVIDDPKKIDGITPELDKMLTIGLMTLENVFINLLE
jgi:PII-like signaling protein